MRGGSAALTAEGRVPEKVVVTGGTGVVGSAVIRALRQSGAEVISFQRGRIDASLTRLGVGEVRGDITDRDAVARACSDADAVVHAAARVDITGPWEDFERINVDGTRVVVDAARRAGVRRFVMVSSPSVAHVGSAIVGGSAEPARPRGARSRYSVSKAMAEELALSEASEDFAVTAIRPHLVWGPGDRQLTERIVERARAGRLVLIGSGAALIDTTYIDNAGSAIAAAVRHAAEPDVRGRAFVVSNGQPRTVAEMLTRIAACAGAPGPRRSVPYPLARAAGRAAEAAWQRRDGDPPITAFLAEQLATAHWFDQRESRRALRWRPEVGLDEGFARLSAWYAGAPAASGDTQRL